MHKTGGQLLAGTALLIVLGIAARAHAETPLPAAATDVASAETAAVDSASADAAAEPQVDVRQWKFKYRGRGVKAEGVVTTLAQPLRDGTFQIVAIEGKRNRSEILALEPSGELITSRGHLFADNRLIFVSPYLNEGGFSYQVSRGRYFNVCYAGPDEGCGDRGYQEFDYRSGARPIEFTLTPLPDVTKIALSQLDPALLAPPIDPEPPDACDADQGAPSVLTTALSWLGFGAPAPASADLTCRPPVVSLKAP